MSHIIELGGQPASRATNQLRRRSPLQGVDSTQVQICGLSGHERGNRDQISETFDIILSYYFVGNDTFIGETGPQ